MILYNALAYLTGYLSQVGWGLRGLSEDIADIYLIGDYLAWPFEYFGGLIVSAAVWVSEAATAWGDIWPEIEAWINARWGLSELAYYADYILSFIQDVWYRVKVIVDYYYPELETFFSDPYGYLYTKITDILADLNISLDDLRWKIIDILADLLPDSWSFLYFPWRWVRDRIVEYNAALWGFLEDPDGWLLDRIQQVNPDLDDFIRDPVGFLWPRLVSWLREKIEDVAEDLLSLAADIISARF